MKSGCVAGFLLAAVAMTPAATAEVAPEDIVWNDGAIETSLTGTPGDPANGQKVFTSRSAGNCIACHSVTALLDVADFHGDVGPLLDGVGDRWSEGELRGIVANAKEWWPDTMMFAFYKRDGYIRPGEGFTGNAPTGQLTTLLEAQQIEDVVAFLMSLRD